MVTFTLMPIFPLGWMHDSCNSSFIHWIIFQHVCIKDADLALLEIILVLSKLFIWMETNIMKKGFLKEFYFTNFYAIIYIYNVTLYVSRVSIYLNS